MTKVHVVNVKYKSEGGRRGVFKGFPSGALTKCNTIDKKQLTTEEHRPGKKGDRTLSRRRTPVHWVTSGSRPHQGSESLVPDGRRTPGTRFRESTNVCLSGPESVFPLPTTYKVDSQWTKDKRKT